MQTDGTDIHLYSLNIACSGNVSRVELFVSFIGISNNAWNETLTLRLLFLENTRERPHILRLVDIISVSVEHRQFKSNSDSVHVITLNLTKHLTVTPVYSRIGLQLPPSSIRDGDNIYNHIPVAELNSRAQRCDSDFDNIKNATGASRLFCHLSIPPVIVTVEDHCNGQETSM